MPSARRPTVFVIAVGEPPAGTASKPPVSSHRRGVSPRSAPAASPPRAEPSGPASDRPRRRRRRPLKQASRGGRRPVRSVGIGRSSLSRCASRRSPCRSPLALSGLLDSYPGGGPPVRSHGNAVCRVADATAGFARPWYLVRSRNSLEIYLTRPSRLRHRYEPTDRGRNAGSGHGGGRRSLPSVARLGSRFSPFRAYVAVVTAQRSATSRMTPVNQ